MIQDIEPHKLDNQYRTQAQPSAGDRVIFLRGGEILLAEGEDPADFPRVSDLPGSPALTYLFAVDETRFFLCRDEAFLPAAGFSFRALNALREGSLLPPERMYAAYTAKHLADWYRDTVFCGRCGARMTPSAKERAMTCACGYTAYPRIMPAVIVGVTKGDRILLTRYRTGFRHNALVAGFAEIGETAEQTVAREVMEETGIRVKNIRYYKSQPWGIANDLLLGFWCEAEGEDPIRMDPGELSRAEWVRREDVELQPGHWSLTNEMMERFKNGEA